MGAVSKIGSFGTAQRFFFDSLICKSVVLPKNPKSFGRPGELASKTGKACLLLSLFGTGQHVGKHSLLFFWDSTSVYDSLLEKVRRAADTHHARVYAYHAGVCAHVAGQP